MDRYIFSPKCLDLCFSFHGFVGRLSRGDLDRERRETGASRCPRYRGRNTWFVGLCRLYKGFIVCDRDYWVPMGFHEDLYYGFMQHRIWVDLGLWKRFVWSNMVAS